MSELIVVRLDPLCFVTSILAFEDFAPILGFNLYLVNMA